VLESERFLLLFHFLFHSHGLILEIDVSRNLFFHIIALYYTNSVESIVAAGSWFLSFSNCCVSLNSTESKYVIGGLLTSLRVRCLDHMDHNDRDPGTYG
jgi:hypothetical protein